jgi:hypothetical protein
LGRKHEAKEQINSKEKNEIRDEHPQRRAVVDFWRKEASEMGIVTQGDQRWHVESTAQVTTASSADTRRTLALPSTSTRRGASTGHTYG